MSNFPRKCVIDTNVPITANRARCPEETPPELAECVLASVEAVEHVVKQGGLVLDFGDEIFDEYRNHLSMKGQPGVGDFFMKWVHDNRWKSSKADRVEIEKIGVSYKEFPDHEGLSEFDDADRKFVAVSNAHPDKPPILQATDSKWWGWKEALNEVGITVQFLCPDYVRTKFEKKIGT